MRSRYSAYVLANSDYLLQTWSESTRPSGIDLSDSPAWLGLKVLRHEPAGDKAVVEFVARYRHARKKGLLHEVSRFECIAGHWFYVDGRLI